MGAANFAPIEPKMRCRGRGLRIRDEIMNGRTSNWLRQRVVGRRAGLPRTLAAQMANRTAKEDKYFGDTAAVSILRTYKFPQLTCHQEQMTNGENLQKPTVA